MYARETDEYRKKSELRIEKLVQENASGITERDTLPNTAQPLHGEVEAMYFNAMRAFLESGIIRDIVNRDIKPFEG